MKAPSGPLVVLILLALVFTIGLTFASLELPRLLDGILARTIDTPDVATGLDAASKYKTDLYLRATRLRPIGYACLAFVLVLIVIGFVTEKTGWTSAGAIALFLPVFGHFAATMFFLGGLGFLRLLWLPALDASFGLFRLADIIRLPYEAFRAAWSWAGLTRLLHPAAAITGLGLLVFFLGTLTWFYARSRKTVVADLWIYRLSRHPQYLGWIIWSYGILNLPAGRIKICYELSNSLPWLLSTMIIVGVAMLEELKMGRACGRVYDAYRLKTPFLIPMPRVLVRASGLPVRLLFKKPYPDRKREIAAVLALYTVLILGMSAVHGVWASRPIARADGSPARIEELARTLKEAPDRSAKRTAAGFLAEAGDGAVDALAGLLTDPDPIVRAYAAGALGGTKADRAVPRLIALLGDADPYVRRTAAESLGRTDSSQAVQPLLTALEDPVQDVVNAAVRALGRIPHPEVIPVLIRALRNDDWGAAGAAAQALGEMGAEEAIEPLIRCFEESPTCPYDRVGTALRQLGSDRAVDAWIAGLSRAGWWYPRAFCASALGRYKMEKGLGPLQDALKDESPQVRRAAVLALMEFRSPATIEALRGALKDEDFEVRLYAKEALKKSEEHE
ncbi:MAG: HEAT repeat domain-containing protein [Candidatus Aminicenantes bacterium]|nr:HEAT repeat domain-containing protein [Candidatus Aminicenantes bacterium]